MIARLPVTLHEHEEQLAVVRADVLSYVPRFVFGLVWTLTPFFFLFPLLRLSTVGIVFIILLSLSGCLYLVNQRASWYGNALVLTNLRCIDVSRHGVAPPKVTAVAWTGVAKIDIVPGRVWRRLLGLGNIRVDLQVPSSLSFLLVGVRRPELVRNLVHEVQYLKRSSV